MKSKNYKKKKEEPPIEQINESIEIQEENVENKESIVDLLFYFLIFFACTNALLIPFYPILADAHDIPIFAIGAFLRYI